MTNQLSSVSPVAAGSGNLPQTAMVWLAQLTALTIGIHLSGQNLVLFLVLPLTCALIDLLSGTVHWFFDTQIDPGPNRLGRIAIDFEDHHQRPQRTLEVGFVPSAFRPAVAVTLPLVTASLLLSNYPWCQAFCFWIGVISMYIPQTHKLAHCRSPNKLTQLAQSTGLILSSKAHRQHHANNGLAYCVFTGWLNPLLDKLEIWRRLEVLLPGARRYE